MRESVLRFRPAVAVLAIVAATAFTSGASASPFNFFQPYSSAPTQVQPEQSTSQDGITDEESFQLPEELARQVVNYPTREAPGTIVIDTGNTYLYLVMGGGKAMRYGIGVGREGFTWSGVQTVARKSEWPDWHPPEEMIQRQPYLPRFMAGGPGNPLGARAMYLGSSIYRIHGTNNPTTIGKRVSSGCIRLTNEDVQDLYSRVNVGTKVVVLPISREARQPQEVSSARVIPAGRSVFQASKLY